jgi:protease I
MAEQSLIGKRVAILAAENFETVELTEPKKALQNAGAQTIVLSTKSGEITGMNHDQKGESIHVDQTIDKANPKDFDAVLLPGGAMNADKLRMDPSARNFVRQMDQAGKPIAVICHAPWLLVSAGLTRGRVLTSYYTIQDDVRNSGGTWKDEEVVHDRNWVSSRSPKDIPAFNQAMIALFSQEWAAETPEFVMGAGEGDRLEPSKPGGAGHIDEVGYSGIYPASSPDAPDDAEARGMASWGQGDRGAQGYEDHGDSELHVP